MHVYIFIKVVGACFTSVTNALLSAHWYPKETWLYTDFLHKNTDIDFFCPSISKEFTFTCGFFVYYTLSVVLRTELWSRTVSPQISIHKSANEVRWRVLFNCDIIQMPAKTVNLLMSDSFYLLYTLLPENKDASIHSHLLII